MKYTKYYNNNKNNGQKFLLSLAMTTIAAIVVGLLLVKVVVKFIPTFNPETNIKVPDANENNVTIEEQAGEESFTFIQCGYFSKEENAKQALSTVGEGYNSFIVQDSDGKYRVSAGIFKPDEGGKVMEGLNSKGVTNAKLEFILKKGDKVQAQIAAITDGYLDIINAVNDKEVKAVKTSDFKKWTEELDNISSGDKIDVLNGLKDHVKALPDEMKKENIIGELQYIYGVLIGFKK
ncbi:hypothetical protein JCM1393_17540 [Clostridium carnis]